MKKNIFALGAAVIAAFALNGCAEELQTVPQGEGGSYTIMVNTADTKTVNDGLKTKWAEKDALNVFHAAAGTTVYSPNTKFTVSDVATGKFTTEALSGALAETNDWYAMYPYNAKVVTPANPTAGYVTVGSAASGRQTQKGNGSMTHIAGANYPMWGIAKGVSKDVVPGLAMTHLSALVEVEVVNRLEEEMAVSSISLTAQEEIVGTYYIDFSTDVPSYTKSGDNYVSKTARLAVEDGGVIAPAASAKFYLAIKPFKALKDQTMDITVNGNKKTLTMPADVVFSPGKIRSLKFNYDFEPVHVDPLAVPAVVDMTSFAPSGAAEYITTNVTGTYTTNNVNTGWKVDAEGEYVQFYVGSTVGLLKISALGNSTSGSSLEVLGSAKGLTFTSIDSYTIAKDEEQVYSYSVPDESYRYFKLVYHKSSGNMSLRKVEFAASDTRVQLATPQNVKAEVVEGTPNSVKVSWDAVENATGYSVTCDEETKDVTDLTCTFESLSYNTEYSISVIAVGDPKTYKPSEAGTTTVTTGASETPAEIYALVTDATELATGDKVIIVSSGSNTALGAQSGSYRAKVDIEISDKTISLDSSEGVEILTLAAGSGAGTFAFMTSGNVYLSLNGDANALNTSDAISDKSSWNIAVSSGGTTIQNVNYTARYINYNSSSPRFACYKTSSKQQPVEIYKLTNSTSGGEGGSTPPVSETAPVFDSVGSSNIGETTALVYCAGTNLTLATELKFYLTGGGTTLSAAASTHYETYASAEFSNLKAATTYTYYVEAKTAGGSVVKSEEGTFTTEKQSTQLPATYGWLELPSKGNVSTASEYVARSGERNYTAYYDTDTYSSLWIAYPLAEGHSGSLSRPEGWYFAPNLDQSVQVDLTGHSYNDGYSRGHQIPNGDRNGDAAMQKQTFYVINSVPQIQNGFNGGIWNALENAVRAEVPSNDSLYIATGPVYKTVGGSESLKYTTAKDDNKNLPVPNYFFKVVLKVKRSGSQITDAKAVGFWFDHKVYSNNSYEACAVSVDEIERKTGYDFFVNLPDSIEAAAETNSNWSTFCSF